MCVAIAYAIQIEEGARSDDNGEDTSALDKFLPSGWYNTERS